MIFLALSVLAQGLFALYRGTSEVSSQPLRIYLGFKIG
jgi:hypothetical protein